MCACACVCPCVHTSVLSWVEQDHKLALQTYASLDGLVFADAWYGQGMGTCTLLDSWFKCGLLHAHSPRLHGFWGGVFLLVCRAAWRSHPTWKWMC